MDLYLKKVCILKSRTLAREACDRGKVLVNGEAAKGSHEVRPGDRIRLDLGLRILEIEVAAIPGKSVSRKQAPDYYRVIEDRRDPDGRGPHRFRHGLS